MPHHAHRGGPAACRAPVEYWLVSRRLLGLDSLLKCSVYFPTKHQTLPQPNPTIDNALFMDGGVTL